MKGGRGRGGGLCRDFQAGKCLFGSTCQFSHGQDGGRGSRHHPYGRPGVSKGMRQGGDAGDAGGPGPQRRQQQQQQGGSRSSAQPGRGEGRQQLQRKDSGGAGGSTPLSPTESYPAPPAEDAAPQQQQPQQQQPQPQRPQPQQPLSHIGRARAMCKLLGMADQASIGALVTKEAEAAAIKYFNAGAFFKQSTFADSIEKFLPQAKQQ